MEPTELFARNFREYVGNPFSQDKIYEGQETVPEERTELDTQKSFARRFAEGFLGFSPRGAFVQGERQEP